MGASRRDTSKPLLVLSLGERHSPMMPSPGQPAPSGEAATCVESSCHLRLESTWDKFCCFVPPLSPEIPNQVTRRRLLQPAARLPSVKGTSDRRHPCLAVHGMVFAVPNSFAVSLATRPSWRPGTPLCRSRAPSPSLGGHSSLEPRCSAVLPWLLCKA